MRAPYKLLLAPVAMLALALALWAGLGRIGWALPGAGGLAILHGPLMLAGFFGTVIGLERAVALGKGWTYAAPAMTAAGAAALLVWGGRGPGPVLAALGSLGLCAVFVALMRRHPALFTATMGLGAAAWLVGNLLWIAGLPLAVVALWWGGFLVLTIAGERLELGRLLSLPLAVRITFGAIVAALLGGLALASVTYDPGVRLLGGALLAMAAWLLRYDIARRTVRKAGLTRYIAVCLLSGFVWLGAAGLLAIAYGGVTAGPHYDAMLHALFVGFVFAMIFGHAPVIVPAVLGPRVAYSPSFYLPLGLLHLSLLLRVSADLALWADGRRWGGLLNAAAILLFLAVMAAAARRAARPRPTPAPGRIA